MLLGILVAWLINAKYININIESKVTRYAREILQYGYGFDHLNEKYLAKWLRYFGSFLWLKIDINLIDRYLVNGPAYFINRMAYKLKNFQTGYIYHYAFIMIIGLFLLMSFFIKL